MTFVGLPIPRIGFNGKLKFRHVCMPYVALAPSAKHKKGDRFDQKCRYNHKFHILVIKELLAEITLQFKGLVPPETTVRILMDGAGPHYHEKTQKRLTTLGRLNIPRVVFEQQEAQSCLLNWNDLWMYNCLESKKNRREYRSSEDVVAGARRAWEELDTETIVRGCKFGKMMMCELLR